ncbi:MarR family winged helix-turn-helix transcriptional regulator [Streptomyces polyrhachis]|uniref:MarR family winged helix-turn-helix transcriptional regulator n=1 Tax=Streptomyces polyrhachis TaxID=1282885 RepID=A0ABW2GKV2_9ACTN
MTESDFRWLTDEEQRVWRAFMHASRDFNAHLDRQLRRDSGIPVAYYQILVMLSEAPGRAMRMGELAEQVNSSRSRLSHAVSALEKSGYVVRCAADGDGRGQVARLTEEGLRVLDAAARGHVTEVRRYLFDLLTPEQLKTLGEIMDGMGEELRGVCERERTQDADGPGGC